MINQCSITAAWLCFAMTIMKSQCSQKQALKDFEPLCNVLYRYILFLRKETNE